MLCGEREILCSQHLLWPRGDISVVTARKTVFSLNLTGDCILGTSTAFSFVVPFWCIAMGETLQYAGWACSFDGFWGHG